MLPEISAPGNPLIHNFKPGINTINFLSVAEAALKYLKCSCHSYRDNAQAKHTENGNGVLDVQRVTLEEQMQALHCAHYGNIPIRKRYDARNPRGPEEGPVQTGKGQRAFLSSPPRTGAFLSNGFRSFNALHPFRLFKAIKNDTTRAIQWDTASPLKNISHF